MPGGCRAVRNSSNSRVASSAQCASSTTSSSTPSRSSSSARARNSRCWVAAASSSGSTGSGSSSAQSGNSGRSAPHEPAQPQSGGRHTGLADGVHDRAERRRVLERGAYRDEHPPPLGDGLLHQPGLADSRLTVDEHQRGRTRHRAAQSRQLRVAPHHARHTYEGNRRLLYPSHRQPSPSAVPEQTSAPPLLPTSSARKSSHGTCLVR